MNRNLPVIIALISIIAAAYPIRDTLAPDKETRHVIKMSEESEENSMLFLGDVMLGRYVAKLVAKNGIDYPFEKLRGLLSSSEDAIINLEGPIPEQYEETPSNGYQFAFPKSATTTLGNAKISAASLANNHASDYGEEGYAHTVRILKESGIVGFGHSRYVSQTLFERKYDDMRVIVFGVNMIAPSWNDVASTNSINRLCSANKGAYVVAFLHWGNEYETTHSKAQEAYAEKILNTCVHAIIGAHPHVVQDIAVYAGKPIFYSLGNAVFDQYFSKETEQGLGVRIVFGKDDIGFELYPIVSEKSQPRLANEEERKIALEKLARKSQETLQDNMRNGIIRVPYPANVAR